MGFFTPSGGSGSRHRRASDAHGGSSSHRSSGGGHRHKSSSGKSSSGKSPSGHGTGSGSSSRASRASDRRSPYESSSMSPSTQDDESVATVTTAATEESEEEEESGSEEEDDDDDDDDDDKTALDYEYANDDNDTAPDTVHAALSQQVRAHVFEHGLRYHAFQAPASAARPGGGKLYALPNDEVEQNRDDMKHAVTVQLMRGELFYAPVQERLAAGGAVYDLGTGTGIWAIEVGDKYPNSVVHGVDLSPIQPNYVPRNVYFVVDDFEDDWDSPPETFDFIHMRHSLWAVADRPALLRRIFHHLKPGGYVEFQEFVPELCLEGEDASSSSAPGTSGGSSSHHHSKRSKHGRHRPPPARELLDQHAPNAYRDFLQYIGMGMRQSDLLAGGDLFPPDDPDTEESPTARLDRELAADLAAAGFRHRRTTTHKAPLGDWCQKHRHLRRNGALLQRAVLDGLRGWAARPLGAAAGGLGWTSTQIEIYLVYVRRALADPAARAYLPLHVTYAQKPE